MAQRTIIPFGPQHPVLPEPLHLDLVLEDERVIEAIPNIGFIHRGLELLCRKKTFSDMPHVAERICGICSVIHGTAYCQAVEKVMAIEIPPRASFLRVFFSELHRVHSHLLWLGLAADAIGFENLFMNAWRIRERILDLFDKMTGSRVILSISKIGGVRKDVSNEYLQEIKKTIKDIEADYKKIADVFLTDYTIATRWKDVGVLSKEDAKILGAVGPTLRGSGISEDARLLKYGAYEFLEFEPVVENGCDAYARAAVRIKEIFTAFDLVRQTIDKMPSSEISIPVKGTPQGEYYSRAEQPRGEVIHYVRGDGTQYLDRYRVRTPTFANLAPVMTMLKGCVFADVPAIILSIDPCISCAER